MDLIAFTRTIQSPRSTFVTDFTCFQVFRAGLKHVILKVDLTLEFEFHIARRPYLVDVGEAQCTNRVYPSKDSWFLLFRILFKNFSHVAFRAMTLQALNWFFMVEGLCWTRLALKYQITVTLLILALHVNLLNRSVLREAHPIDWYAAIHTINKLIQIEDLALLNCQTFFVLRNKTFFIWVFDDPERVLANLSFGWFFSNTLEFRVGFPDLFLCQMLFEVYLLDLQIHLYIVMFQRFFPYGCRSNTWYRLNFGVLAGSVYDLTLFLLLLIRWILRNFQGIHLFRGGLKFAFSRFWLRLTDRALLFVFHFLSLIHYKITK